jgi:hypothetical protein
VVRGMVEKGAPIQEVFEDFNHFLVHEWSGGQTGHASGFNVTARAHAPSSRPAPAAAAPYRQSASTNCMFSRICP